MSVMQILKLGLELFFKRLFVNVLIVVQLAVVGVLACALMAEIQNMNYTNQLASSIFSPDGYIYYMMSSEEHAYRVQGKKLPEDAIKPEEYVKSLHAVEDASTVINIEGSSSIGDIQLKGYSGKMLDTWKPKLAKGVAITDAPNTNVIEVLATGETDDCTLGATLMLQLPDDKGKIETYKLKVVGILEKPVFLLNNSSAGALVSGNALLRYTPSVSFVFNTDASKNTGILDAKYIYPINNYFVLFEEGISREDYDANFELMSKYGNYITYEELQKNHSGDIEWLLDQNLATIIFLLVCTLFGFVCITIINTATYKNKLSIFYICGAKLSTCFGVLVSYIFIILVISFGLMALGLFLIQSLGNFSSLIPIFFTDMTTQCLMALPLYGVFAIVSLVVPMVVLSKNTLKQSLYA